MEFTSLASVLSNEHNFTSKSSDKYLWRQLVHIFRVSRFRFGTGFDLLREICHSYQISWSHTGDPGVDAVPLVAVVGAESDLVLVAVLQLAEVVAVAVAVGRVGGGGGVLREGGDGAVHLGGGVEVVLVLPAGVVHGPEEGQGYNFARLRGYFHE